MDWYYVENKKRVGPVGDEQFRALVNEGKIDKETLVWNETLTDWTPFEKIALSIPEPISVKDPGNDPSPMKPENHTAVESTAILMTGMTYAGFWIRFAAKLIDGIIMTVISVVINFVIAMFIGMPGPDMNPDQMGSYMGLMFIPAILQWGINIFYVTWFLGKFGATPGKMACRLEVVTAENEKISYLKAFARFFAEFLSGIIFFIGYIMAAFDSEKRALHDRICDTRVVKK